MKILSQIELLEIIYTHLNEWSLEEEELNETDDGEYRFNEAAECLHTIIVNMSYNRNEAKSARLAFDEKCGLIALGEYLSEWPDGLTYEQVMELFQDEQISFPEVITPCEFFEDWCPAALANRIDALKDTLERNF